MKKTKTKTESEIERDEFIKAIGEEVRIRLDSRHKKEPNSPLPYRIVMSCHGAAAKKAGFASITALSDKLEELGYIFVFEAQSGARYIFSGNCKLSEDDMFAKMYEIEHDKFQQKIIDREMRKNRE